VENKSSILLEVIIKETKLITNSDQEANNGNEPKYSQTDLHHAFPVRAKPEAHSLFETTTHWRHTQCRSTAYWREEEVKSQVYGK
jgi:hypothetical protein